MEQPGLKHRHHLPVDFDFSNSEVNFFIPRKLQLTPYGGL